VLNSSTGKKMTQDKNEEVKKADEYLKQHRIMELFNDLAASVCFHKPEDLKSFLIQELQLREREGAEAGNFEDSEIKAVFGLADLMQMGVISDQQAKAALFSLANSQKQKEQVEGLELPAEVDEITFQQKAKGFGEATLSLHVSRSGPVPI
ncbi:unnamed protein product, partial [Polarella glacialis]